MKKIICIILLFIGCSQNSNTPKLLIKTEKIDIDKFIGHRDTITVINSKYFDIDLMYDKYSVGYKAEKILIDIRKTNLKKSELYYIVDEVGNQIIYNSSTEFLNYMDKMGYEIITQNNEFDKIKYSFKRIK